MPGPSYEVALEALFKDLGARKGLEALTGATLGLSEATKNLRDKTFAATGTVRGFADAGKEGYLDLAANLSRTAVLQGKVYSQTGDILAAQIKASSEAIEHVSTVQEFQTAFEAVGKAAVRNIGEFVKLNKVLHVPPSALASMARMLEAQGFTEKGTISLTQELGGLATQMGVDPGPLLSQMPELINLVRDRAAALGKEGPAFIRKYLKENVALSAALTSQVGNSDEAAAAVVALSRTTFESTKQMKAALAGVGEGSLPELLRMVNISIPEFTTAFDFAAKEGPLALVQAFQKKTEEIRKNTKNDKRALENWRQIVDKTMGDPALTALIVDGQKDVGKASAATQAPLEANIEAYKRLEDATMKNAKELRKRRDIAWDNLKILSAEKIVVPALAPLWDLQSKAVEWATTKLGEWNTSGDKTKATMATLAGATVLYSGDVLDWTIKAGGAVKNLKEVGTSVVGVAGALKGVGGKLRGVGKAIEFMKLPMFNKTVTTAVTRMTEWGAVTSNVTTVLQKGAIPTILTGISTTITGSVVPALASMGASLGTVVLAAAPFVAIAGALAYLAWKAHEAFSAQAEGANNAASAVKSLQQREEEVVHALVAEDKANAKVFTSRLASANTMEKEQMLAKERLRLQKAGRLGAKKPSVQAAAAAPGMPTIPGMETVNPPRSPTPALPIGALPHGGGAATRLAIQVLEEARAQTGILEQIAAALGAIPGMGAPAPAAPSSMRIDMRPDSGGLRLDRMLEVRARNVLGRSGYPQFGRTAFTH